MENKMKDYLKEEYDEKNHIKNFLLYWQKSYGKPRVKNDLDCLYCKGEKLADTIYSMWMPIKMVVKCLHGEIVNKKYKDNDPLKDINKLIQNYSKYFPENNILICKLNELAVLAETRANVMILPKKGMQSRGRYDQMNLFLWSIFKDGNKSKFFDGNDDLVRKWIVEQKLQPLFVCEKELKRENIKPLIETLTPNISCFLEEEAQIKEMLDMNICVLKERTRMLKMDD